MKSTSPHQQSRAHGVKTEEEIKRQIFEKVRRKMVELGLGNPYYSRPPDTEPVTSKIL